MVDRIDAETAANFVPRQVSAPAASERAAASFEQETQQVRGRSLSVRA